jgi:hypothetical protein
LLGHKCGVASSRYRDDVGVYRLDLAAYLSDNGKKGAEDAAYADQVGLEILDPRANLG